MELVPLVCLFVVAWSGIASAADGPTVVKQVEKEDGDAVLNCSLGENAQEKLFSWRKVAPEEEEVITISSNKITDVGRLFQDRVSHFSDALKSGNASIVIRGAKVSDSGNYTCEFPNDAPKIRSIIFLTVEKILKDRSAEKTTGAPAKPSIRTIGQTEGGVLLQCKVLSAFPKPRVEWRDSAGTVLQAEEPQVTSRDDGKYDTVLNITVTKSDNFKCIATQKEIYHQLHDETFVYPFGTVTPQIETLDETNEWEQLQCTVRGVSPKTILQWKDSFKNVIPAKEPEVIERGGSYDIILQTTVTKSDDYYCVATQENGLQTEAKTYVGIGGPAGLSYGAVAGVAGGAVVVTAVITAVVCLFIYKRCNRSHQSGKYTAPEE